MTAHVHAGSTPGPSARPLQLSTILALSASARCRPRSRPIRPDSAGPRHRRPTTCSRRSSLRDAVGHATKKFLRPPALARACAMRRPLESGDRRRTTIRLTRGSSISASTAATSPCTTLRSRREAALARDLGQHVRRQRRLRRRLDTKRVAGSQRQRKHHSGIIAGKLNGVMPTQTPTVFDEYESTPRATSGRASPIMRTASAGEFDGFDAAPASLARRDGLAVSRKRTGDDEISARLAIVRARTLATRSTWPTLPLRYAVVHLHRERRRRARIRFAHRNRNDRRHSASPRRWRSFLRRNQRPIYGDLRCHGKERAF